jgi:hypothetical protein
MLHPVYRGVCHERKIPVGILVVIEGRLIPRDYPSTTLSMFLEGYIDATVRWGLLRCDVIHTLVSVRSPRE